LGVQRLPRRSTHEIGKGVRPQNAAKKENEEEDGRRSGSQGFQVRKSSAEPETSKGKLDRKEKKKRKREPQSGTSKEGKISRGKGLSERLQESSILRSESWRDGDMITERESRGIY